MKLLNKIAISCANLIFFGIGALMSSAAWSQSTFNPMGSHNPSLALPNLNQFQLGGGALGALQGSGGTPQIRSLEPLPPAIQNNTQWAWMPALKQNDFQKYVLEVTGQKIPLFGSGFFENVQLNQQLQSQWINAQSMGAVPSALIPSYQVTDFNQPGGDYVLGSGDQVIVRGWGSIDLDVRAVIDRNGQIHLPKIGAVGLGGIRLSQAEAVVRSAVSRQYRDFQLAVSVGQMRSISVMVVGQARKPGTFHISSAATISSALLLSGGPNAVGSMRRVQLKRAGVLVSEFDLYDLLTKGESQTDARLADGDVIVIPPATGYVALLGKVNNPAILEIRSESESLEQLLQTAGGLPLLADTRNITLERLHPSAAGSAGFSARSVETIALRPNAQGHALRSGDVFTFQELLPELSKSVTLRGKVPQARKLPWREGVRVRDLIPSREYLISRETLRKQNEVLFDQYQKERTQREREMIPEDLTEDRELAQRVLGERQFLTQAVKPTERSKNSAEASPGVPQLSAAGLPLNDHADLLAMRESRQRRLFSIANQGNDANAPPLSLVQSVGNLYEEINWDYAVVERLEPKTQNVRLIPFPLGAVLDNPNHPDNHLLQPGDIVTVFSAEDMQVPVSKRRVMVRVEGEVAQPGIYQMTPGEGLPSLLKKAGGLTADAYLFGAGLFREEVRRAQQENLSRLISRLEAESQAQLAQLSQSVGASSDPGVIQAKIAAAERAQRKALERVRSLKPEGRIALGLDAQVATSNLPDIRLRNGDRFIVPARPDFVYVYGAVNTESALIYRPGLRVKDYLRQSGVGTVADVDAIILVRADGSALTEHGVFASVLNTPLMPGDSIVVPEKLDVEATWSKVIRNTRDLTQILYQLGLGAAAIKTLRQ